MFGLVAVGRRNEWVVVSRSESHIIKYTIVCCCSPTNNTIHILFSYTTHFSSVTQRCPTIYFLQSNISGGIAVSTLNGTKNNGGVENGPGRTPVTFPSFKSSPLSPLPVQRKLPEAAGTQRIKTLATRNEPINDAEEISTVGTLGRPGGKRKGVDSGISKLDDVKIEKFEKDDRVKQMLRHAIIGNDFMSNVVYKNRLELVVNCMVPEEIPADTFLIREGDPGSCFYVSAEGSFEVLKKDVQVSVFGPGVVFGELAILYKARRFASIRAISDVKVWKLDRKVLQKIMREIAMNELQDNLRFLRSVKTFEKYDLETLSRIADLLKRELYVGGSRIIRQGDAGDKFYIIRGGTVTITKINAEGVEQKISTLARGAYFGEKALLADEKRTANIYANPPGTECLVLDKDSFLKHVYVDSFASPRSNQVRLSSNRLTTGKLLIKNICPIIDHLFSPQSIAT